MLLIALFLLAASIAQTTAPDPLQSLKWKQIHSAADMWIYQADVENSDVVAFRAEGIIEAPIERVATVLLDHQYTFNWVDMLREHRVIHRYSLSHYVEYTHMGTPVVVKDRDFVTDVQVTGDLHLGLVQVLARSIDHPQAPSTHYIRGQVVHQSVRLEREKNGNTRLNVAFHIDPKGSVPKWVVNLFYKGWPRKCFRNIQRQVQTRTAPTPDWIEKLMKELKPQAPLVVPKKPK